MKRIQLTSSFGNTTLAVLLSLLLLLPASLAQRCPLSTRDECEGVGNCHDFMLSVICECNWERQCFDGGDDCIDYGICTNDDESLVVCESGCYGCHDLDGSREYLCLCDPTTELGVGCPGGASCRDEYEYSYCVTREGSSPCLSAFGVVDVFLDDNNNNNKQLFTTSSRFLQDVTKGDDILVVYRGEEEKNVYETVYAFGHKNEYAAVTFLQFHTTSRTSSAAPLEVTGEHLVYISDTEGNGAAVRADSVQVGDLIMSDDPLLREEEVVLEITRVDRQGIFSPLTPRGSFLANGVQVSSYTAIPQGGTDKQYWELGRGGETLVSHHFWNHIAMAPFRFLCRGGYYSNVCQDRNAKGQLLVADFGERLTLWKAPAVWVQAVIAAGLFVLLISFYVLEQYGSVYAVVPVLLLCFIMICKKKKKKGCY